jgi:hypothetical protein
LQEPTSPRPCATHFIIYYYFFTAEFLPPSDITVGDHASSVSCSCILNITATTFNIWRKSFSDKLYEYNISMQLFCMSIEQFLPFQRSIFNRFSNLHNVLTGGYYSLQFLYWYPCCINSEINLYLCQCIVFPLCMIIPLVAAFVSASVMVKVRLQQHCRAKVALMSQQWRYEDELLYSLVIFM